MLWDCEGGVGQLWSLGSQQRQRVRRVEDTLGSPRGRLPLCVVGRHSASRNLRLGWGREEYGVLETAQFPLKGRSERLDVW